MTQPQHAYLRRLPAGSYRGNAYVHWTMAIDGRRTGWLDALFHAHFREMQLHTLSRYRILCPVYCLMPDHLHVFWIGLSPRSDLMLAARFLRKEVNALLEPAGQVLQKQGYDSVLRAKDRERGAVEKLIFYISENPVRAELVSEAPAWPYSGSQAAGYPQLDWRDAHFPRRLWRIAALEMDKEDWREQPDP